MRMTSVTSPLRILLVEDSRGDALLIEKALQQAMPEMYHIQKADTLAAALKILAENEFDIALLDRSLPDTVDYSGLQRIQNMGPKLPVVYLTAYKDEETALEFVKQGAQDYLIKGRVDGHTIRRAIQFAIIRKQFENVLILQANFDNLTGLANRMLFENRLDIALAKMRRHEGDIGVIFLDLNRFKEVNDTHGHAVGDRLLVEMGTRLKNCLRSGDTAARFGGDEFALLLEGTLDTERCTIVAQKIIRATEDPFVISGIALKIGVSIGIATCNAKESCTRLELIQRADRAMYEAKTSTGSCYLFFSAPMQGNLDAPMQLKA